MSKGKTVERGALGVFKFLTWIIYALAMVAIVVLGFGFVLLLLGAKPVGFAETIYNIGVEFMNPFKGMITPTATGAGGVIAWNVLIAILFYAIAAWVLGAILDWISHKIYRTKQPATPAAVPAAAVAAAPVAQPATSVAATPAPEPAAPAAAVAEPEAAAAEPEPEVEAPAEPVEEPAEAAEAEPDALIGDAAPAATTAEPEPPAEG